MGRRRRRSPCPHFTRDAAQDLSRGPDRAGPLGWVSGLPVLSPCNPSSLLSPESASNSVLLTTCDSQQRIQALSHPGPGQAAVHLPGAPSPGREGPGWAAGVWSSPARSSAGPLGWNAVGTSRLRSPLRGTGPHKQPLKLAPPQKQVKSCPRVQFPQSRADTWMGGGHVPNAQARCHPDRRPWEAPSAGGSCALDDLRGTLPLSTAPLWGEEGGRGDGARGAPASA